MFQVAVAPPGSFPAFKARLRISRRQGVPSASDPAPQAAGCQLLDLAAAGAREEGQDQVAGVLQQAGQRGEAVAFGVVGQDHRDPRLAVEAAADRLVADRLGGGSHDGGGFVDQVPVASEGDPVAAQRVCDRGRAGLAAPGGKRLAWRDAGV